MLVNSNLSEIHTFISQHKSFVLNIVATWCPDCTERQANHIDAFAFRLAKSQLDVYQLTVQQEKRVYLDSQLEEFVVTLGGHGFPRTVLFLQGEAVDTDNVEVFTEEGLADLADKFENQARRIA